MMEIYRQIEELFLISDSDIQYYHFSEIRGLHYSYEVALGSAKQLFETETGEKWKRMKEYEDCENEYCAWERKMADLMNDVKNKQRRLNIPEEYPDPCAENVPYLERLKKKCPDLINSDGTIIEMPLFNPQQPCLEVTLYYLDVKRTYLETISNRITEWKRANKNFERFANQVNLNIYYMIGDSGQKIIFDGGGLQNEFTNNKYEEYNNQLHEIEQFLGANKPRLDLAYKKAKKAVLNALIEAKENGISKKEVEKLFKEKAGFHFPSLDNDPLGIEKN
ncbi:MAG: SurA N-terminal domain-containing protein [Saprospiraceae bacterium]|nr:SurA N-terminal domain-containing protein [Saprospiraceae bacterium]